MDEDFDLGGFDEAYDISQSKMRIKPLALAKWLAPEVQKLPQQETTLLIKQVGW